MSECKILHTINTEKIKENHQFLLYCEFARPFMLKIFETNGKYFEAQLNSSKL